MNRLQNITVKDYEGLFKAHYAELCAYANHIINDIEEAEEIIQSLFVKLWESRQELKIEKSPKAYLYTATRNACYNLQKHVKIKEAYKAHNQRELDSQNTYVDEEYQAGELDEKIKTAIGQLSDGRKEIFILSRYEGLKYKEIAEKLKISIKTVENQMSSAIKHLRVELAEFIVAVGYFIIVLKQFF